MDKFLRPPTLDVDPESPTAADEWEMWLSNFNAFFNAIDASLSPDKLALLRAHISCATYKLIKNAKTFLDAEEILKRRFVKPRSEVYARHRLFTRRQQPGESLSQFLDELRSLSLDCNFQAADADTITEEAIRDAFINGMASNGIRQRLLEFMKLDLSSAVNQARAMEMAQLHSESYAQSTPAPTYPTAAVAAPTDTPERGETVEMAAKLSNHTSRKCFFCGLSYHPLSECRAKNVTCHKCGREGHYARVCQSTARRKIQMTSAFTDITASSLDCLSPSIAMVSINGKPLRALIDTGSSKSFIRTDIARSFKDLQINSADGLVAMASNRHRMRLREKCCVQLELKGRTYSNVSLSLLDDLCAPVLLGHDFLRQHESVSLEFGGKLPSLSVCGLIAASIDPPPLFSDLSPDCKPIQTKSRRHSEADQKFIEKEVARLLREGIIVPSRSPWRAQALVVTQGDKKRLVIDYAQTVNRFTRLNAYPLPGITDMVEKISKFKVFSSIDLSSDPDPGRGTKIHCFRGLREALSIYARSFRRH